MSVVDWNIYLSAILWVTAYFQTLTLMKPTQESKNTGSTKEDVFYTFTSRNLLNIFKCGIFHQFECVFMGYNLLLK